MSDDYNPLEPVADWRSRSLLGSYPRDMGANPISATDYEDCGRSAHNWSHY